MLQSMIRDVVEAASNFESHGFHETARSLRAIAQASPSSEELGPNAGLLRSEVLVSDPKREFAPQR